MKLLYIGLIAVMTVCTGVPSVSSTAYTTTKEFQPNGQSPALSPNEMYRDMFVIGTDNFTDTVLRHEDPWIVIFHDGTIDKSWKTMATNMRGLCWVGLVDVRYNKQLLQDMMYSRREEVARVYPYGSRNTKERKWTRTQTPEAAIMAAMSKLPDKTLRMTGSEVKDLYTDSFLTVPSRCPVYLVTDQEETSHLFKAISTRFEKYFNFGRIVRPTPADLKELGLGLQSVSYPSLFVMVSTDGTVENIHALQYQENKLGHMNYTSILQFLFAINLQYRHVLPGNNMANSQQEAEMADIMRIEEKRFDIQFPRSAGNQHAGVSKSDRNHSKRQQKSHDNLDRQIHEHKTVSLKPDERGHIPVYKDEL